MNKSILTDRLYLRQFLSEDALHLYQMNQDPEVIKFTGDAPFNSLQEAAQFIAEYDTYNKTGIGRYAVIRSSDNVFLGWCGLKYQPSEGAVDIGYRFYRKYWGNGYAIESGKAVLSYAFDTLNYPFLIANAHIENYASHAVLNKLGFEQVEEISYDGQPSYRFVKTNKKVHLKKIIAEETWPVRHPVLRKGRPLKDVYMEADEQSSTFHLGIYYNDSIAGVASFMKDSFAGFKNPQYRLRGMAVLPKYRRKGYAALLLKKGEDLLKEKQIKTLWFNARIGAHSFYSALGYDTVSTIFEIEKVGPHYRMKKELV